MKFLDKKEINISVIKDKAKDIFNKAKKLAIKKQFYIPAAAVIVLIAAAIGILSIDSVRYSMRDWVNLHFPDKLPYYIYYENNVPHYNIDEVDFDKNDVREVQVGNNRKYLINHSRGFALGFKRDAEFDFSAAQEYISVKCSDMDIVVSKEYSTYATAQETKAFIKDYLHKYLLNEKYMQHNKITLHKDAVEKIGNFWVQMVAISRTPAPDSNVKYNTYVYCYIYTDSTMFYRIMFKAADYNDELLEEVYRTLYSFSTDVKVRGVSGTFTDFKPVIPKNWSDETKKFYNDLVNSDFCKWGVYVPHAVVNNDFTEINKLENELGETFDGLIEYRYYFEDMPVEGMKKAYEKGKTLELTIQTSTVMNGDLDSYNPVFDILDGRYDWRFRVMAHQIKEVGHPVLLRLNNEMNSDWTSYGSSACLDDPSIYVELWRKIYDIFTEVGVDNAIWIFNPNDESFPPCGYNSSMAFYPGDEYVQVFGVTGYNTGTYYDELNGEKWKTFSEIYDNIMTKHHHVYDNFPWIITEFASSSIGGDKVQWINDMFRDLKKYKNIKMAFWFNSADLDERPEFAGAVARPYWLDETPETAKAFSDGLRQSKKGD